MMKGLASAAWSKCMACTCFFFEESQPATGLDWHCFYNSMAWYNQNEIICLDKVMAALRQLDTGECNHVTHVTVTGESILR